jgi:hypothetical protein
MHPFLPKIKISDVNTVTGTVKAVQREYNNTYV